MKLLDIGSLFRRPCPGCLSRRTLVGRVEFGHSIILLYEWIYGKKISDTTDDETVAFEVERGGSGQSLKTALIVPDLGSE